MRKSILSVLAASFLSALSPALQAQVQPFTAGDVAIYRTGTGVSALNSAGTAVFIDEYSPTGTLVQSIPMPTAASGGNFPLIASGSASSEGELSLSGNGQYLLLTGYDAAVGTTSIASSTSANVPRVIGTVSGNGVINTSTTLNTFSGNNIRSAASADGTNLYAAGANIGVVYTTLGSNGNANTGTIVANANSQAASVTNLRQMEVYNNQLYTSSSTGSLSTSIRIATVGSGLPTTTGSTIDNVPGIVGSNATTPPTGPYGFAFANLGSAANPDTLYVADNTANAVEKFSLVSGSYVQTGSISVSGVTGVSVQKVVGSGEQIFANSASTLFSILDASGFDGTLSGTATTIATAASNEAFRGEALVPTPEPTSAFLLLALPALLRRRHAKVLCT